MLLSNHFTQKKTYSQILFSSTKPTSTLVGATYETKQTE